MQNNSIKIIYIETQNVVILPFLGKSSHESNLLLS